MQRHRNPYASRGPKAIPQIQSRLPSPIRPAETCAPTQAAGSGYDSSGGGGGSGVQTNEYKLGIDPLDLQAAINLVMESGPVFRTRPSPIDQIPYRGKVRPIFARAVIAPPTAPGDAEGATAAAALAKAEAAFGGSVITPLTPATTSAFVTVASFTPSPGSAFVVRGVGVWGHDLRAMRDLIRWRVSIGGSVISDERELGMIGSLDNPTLVYGVAREGQTLTVDARNLDERSPSLVEVAVFGWEFPVDGAAGDSLASLMDPRG